MRKILLVAVAAATVAVAAACSSKKSGSDDGSSGTPTPTGTIPGNPTLTFSISGSGFGPHNGDRALVRVLSSGVVAFCNSSATISGASFTITSGNAVLVPGASYSAELFANIDGNTTFDANDHYWAIPIGVVTSDVVIDFHHTTQFSAITWTPGTDCPGT